MTKKIAISLPDEESANEPFEEMIAALIHESGASESQIRTADEESRKVFERAGLTRRKARRETGSRKTD